MRAVCPSRGAAVALGGAGRGEQLVAGALEWIGAHPLLWAALVATCRELSAQGWELSRTNVTFAARRRSLAVTGDPGRYRFEHMLWSPLARLMARYCDDLEFPTARCCVDEAYPTPESLPALPEGCEPGEGGRWGVPAGGGEGR